ncbi:hypothetical protein ACINWC323_1784 [Acinetobacter sp. WC-323]|uniref:type II toxin-antitoxin system toxin DNA ADP-ribosyl transferase DarT n=1 Tax=Acinetobacter sp. WC-323 TaxID=903918 RepID=UPI00029DF617|nr:DUF4433 domain-containing protein [Acinetobacter sp. WC-323]EKU51524.1 hypothetical protein ACINWC323_1784 [Acinetobacter sp. WC-323]
MPMPTRLFHMTAIDNLDSILNKGSLICKNSCTKDQIRYGNIAHSSVQNKRNSKNVPVPPHGSLHDYVPFYFAPRSPMLYVINQGNVDGCDYRQDSIIYLQTTVEKILETNNLYVFTDRNASLDYATFENDHTKLPQTVNWTYLTSPPAIDGYCKFFHDTVDYPQRREMRQAEFLVYNTFPIDLISAIGVHNNDALMFVKDSLRKYHLNIPVSIKPDWYF